ncbi:hypothetical protein FVEG_14625 [Fusarium verticillioides 7600]|uniref:Uncharacterized protein n=1 Tax=Gibberella moniliformis (strain M3125 / FGSC 7600) TaxID=334819 RepID=W7LBZ4_GIBM7|nr:hypothetical protein FVEG_14625 [Fusarium verticillioides 7600]EWG36131.1 hypothetical protein FVEG_14625 [Fusarium verticillioides 7600]
MFRQACHLCDTSVLRSAADDIPVSTLGDRDLNGQPQMGGQTWPKGSTTKGSPPVIAGRSSQSSRTCFRLTGLSLDKPSGYAAAANGCYMVTHKACKVGLTRESAL